MPNQKVQAAGPIFQINLERQTFKLRTPDNQTITAPYTTQTVLFHLLGSSSPIPPAAAWIAPAVAGLNRSTPG